MDQFVNEPFTGVAGDNLSTANPSWMKVPGVTGDAIIASTGDRVRFSGSTLYYLNSPAPLGLDYSATLDLNIVSTQSGPGVGVALYMSSTLQTYYLARLLNGTGIQMYRVVNGSSTLLGSAAYTAATGATLRLRLERIGTALNTYVDDAATPAITAPNETAIAGPGFIGLRAINTTTQLQADNLSAATPSAAGQDGIAALTGVSSSPAVGSAVASGGAAAALSGAAATPAVGSIVASAMAGGGANAIILGVAADPRAGNIAARGGALAVVGGVSEDVAPIGAPLGGVAANPQVGQISARAIGAPLEIQFRRIPLERDFRLKTVRYSN